MAENLSIWKFELTEREITLEMPRNSVVFHCHEQRGEVCLWAAVDRDEPMVLRQFEIIGTGWKFGDDVNRNYVGTAHLKDTGLVWHVFEILPKE